MKLRKYQQHAVDNAINELATNKSTLVVLPTGCHERGQKILLHTGRMVNVEDVVVGDTLMGPDGSPRNVLQLCRNRGKMYRIIPTKGEPFVVNEDHVLSLQRVNDGSGLTGEIVDVSVKDYMKWGKTSKHIHKLFRVGVDFAEQKRVPLDPYFLGVLIGDGSCLSSVGITTEDKEIEVCVREVAKSFGLSVTDRPAGNAKTYLICGKRGPNGNKLIRVLDSLGIMHRTGKDKFVPHYYKVGSRETRLQVLAGLMDTDGSLAHALYDYISVSETLANDVAFMARSVGLAAYVSQCQKGCQTGAVGTYYRVCISGDCSIIPCRLPRKKSPVRLQKKSVLRTGFKVEYVGVDDYFGFVIDGDHRYLMGDFTVTHNSGKTVVFSKIAEHFMQSGRVMVLAHREELIRQAATKIKAVTGYHPSVEMAAEWSSEDGFNKPKIVVSSVQTLCTGRVERFNPEDFSLVITDECHHGTSKSYSFVYNHMLSKGCRHLGVTATPDRADEQALGKVFDTVAYDYELPNIIEDGWLVPVKQRLVTVTGLDYSRAKVTAGDLNQGDVAAAQANESILHEMIDPIIEIVGKRKTIIFATPGSKKPTEDDEGFHIAERMTEIINRYKANSARRVSQDTPKDERRQMLAEFAEGKFQFLVNVGVLTEGFDDPSIEVVAITRPTKSRSLYSQMVGRGTRPLPGIVDQYEHAHERRHSIATSTKPHVEILDFVGNSGRHKLVNTADILGGNYEQVVIDKAVKKATDESVDMTEALKEAYEETKDEREKERRAKILAKTKFQITDVDPFDVFDLQPIRERAWDKGKPPTPAQLYALRSMGIPQKHGLTRAQAGQLLSEAYRRRDEGLVAFHHIAKGAEPGMKLTELNKDRFTSWQEKYQKIVHST